jgi:hypothetical protein
MVRIMSHHEGPTSQDLRLQRHVMLVMTLNRANGCWNSSEFRSCTRSTVSWSHEECPTVEVLSIKRKIYTILKVNMRRVEHFTRMLGNFSLSSGIFLPLLCTG